MNVTLRRVCLTFLPWKPIRITYSVSVSVALVIHHPMHMRHIILSSVACLAVPYFPTLSHKGNDFRKNINDQKTCALIFCTAFFTQHFSVEEELSEILSQTYTGLHVKYQLLVSGCKENYNF
jgi:hypothetical protein